MPNLITKLADACELFFKSRFAAISDLQAWLLIAPAVLALYFIDRAMALTLLQWTLFGIALAGAAVIISRAIFPHIKLSDLVESAQHEKNTGAGLVASAIVIFVGLVMLALVHWAKA